MTFNKQINDLLDEAVELLEEEKYKTALTICKYVQQLETNNIRVAMLMGCAYCFLGLDIEELNDEKINHFKMAVEYFEKGFDLCFDCKDARLFAYAGIAYYYVGDIAKALFYAKASIDTDSNDPLGYLLMGDLFENTGNTNEAQIYYQKAKSSE